MPTRLFYGEGKREKGEMGKGEMVKTVNGEMGQKRSSLL
jgi:hypothetical protein